MSGKFSSFLHNWKTLYPYDPTPFLTTSTPRAVTTGCGFDIFTKTLLPALLSAHHEILFVTCFWDNPSPTLTALSDTLTQLAARRAPGSAELIVRIGFSSRSAWQRLRHGHSSDGEVYTPEAWHKVLGLPSQETLKAGNINLAVKSLFWRPFSVAHPKLIVVDRRRAWVPSCNVAREVWFEGCIGFDGDGVKALVDFWRDVWGRGQAEWKLGPGEWEDDINDDVWGRGNQYLGNQSNGINLPVRHVVLTTLPSTPTLILPSSHSTNPHFRPFPFAGAKPSRPTPLNSTLLTLFANAQSCIDIITPNLTCGAVVNALLEALARGVDVKIRTSQGMMVLEQLVTAGSLTSWWVKGMIAAHQRMCSKGSRERRTWWEWVLGIKKTMSFRSDDGRELSDLEARPVKPGTLEIMYYRQDPQRLGQTDEPTMSHFKMTLVDGQFVVLGSGNMDRASWYTSQELGILLHAPEWDSTAWEGSLATREEIIYKSN